MIRTIQRLQSQHIRAGAVEGEENFDVAAEVLLKFRSRHPRIRIISVRDHVPFIRARNGIENFAVHSGVVVAGKTAAGFREYV